MNKFKPYFLCVDKNGNAIKINNILNIPDGFEAAIYIYNKTVENKYLKEGNNGNTRPNIC